ncbi:large neutral amino acids transporter small subunit 2 [Frankliniella occidentalis]|uniref:Large neutral amino acids transporter small subunit 2 n=1 Tax=Frankliniella occidentalis TaxID=133901 RepID=A0A9C6XBD7_FRAOC|nr:large neutral amino acids transporter small subunit 2 [Frankliniella occidentalis]
MGRKVVPVVKQAQRMVHDGLVPAAEGQTEPDASSQGSGIKLRKELGLLDGVAIIVGVIIGAGIFVSPKGVLQNTGSIGVALIVWVLCGGLSLIGALCYAELGTMIPRSGGDYAYIGEAFGPLPAFLYLWVALFVIVPTGNAITALTFAQYILQPAWPTCEPPDEVIRLIAAIVTCVLTAINCYNVKWATRVQDLFTGTKLLALVVIILTGLYALGAGKTENFQQPFQNTITSPGHIALSFYSGLFSYAGWNYLNFVTEELKDPYRNLPRAICISLPMVTIIYVLANIAYFVVLTRDELLSSNAVAVLFGEKMLAVMSWTMPVFVACSTFGALNGAIFASSRLFFVGARQGHLPTAIALINVKRLTPVPSLVFLCIITLVLLVIKDVYVLINYVSFVESFFTLVSVSGLLYMRRSKPDLHRPIKVSIVLPLIFFVICTFLVTCPFYVSPVEVGVGIAIILAGIPVYFVFIYWKNKPDWLTKSSHAFNLMCARLFECVLEDQR